ncbi:ribonuclease T2 [Wolfiporia cocos MD-104 SS10]|uniref:ribonuclease T2 n=1 Tax=Wolfiporia cocos (strain MD-104) TaxID=742152 RepID=A0A2H3IVL1_WOLCO|nr:ribonuclease T2 [Wolfiporia cocos MD-104 SS10]
MAIAGAGALVSLVLASQAAAFGWGLDVPNTYPDISSCLAQPLIYSCENTTAVTDTCCTPSPGGQVLQAQFWDTYTGRESYGQLLPKGSWGIHGLWPDNCDGTWNSYCDLSRQYDPDPDPAVLSNGTVVPPYHGPGVETFIIEFGRLDLLDYMTKYWINQGAPNEDLWAHEFSKHATCTSTYDVACYGPDYKEHQDVVDFYLSVVRAFQKFPTYDILAASGIVPSNKTTYSLSQIQAALRAQTGAVPYLGCGGENGTILQEVWYFNHVLGTEQFGQFKSIDTVETSTCNTTLGIWYYERTPTSEHDVNVMPCALP